MRAKVPFIVGAPRSGTTLLRAMLDSHPQLAIPFESHFVPHLLRETEKGKRRRVPLAAFYIHLLAEEPRFLAWSLPIDAVATEIGRIGRDPAPADLIRATFMAWSRQVGKERWGDKTPRYALEVGALARAFPEAVFIHLIRDGRDVAASYLGSAIGPSTIKGASVAWSLHVEEAQRAGRALPSGRYIEVEYEALVSHPISVLREICTGLDLKFSNRMLDYPKRFEQLTAGAMQREAHARVRLSPQIGVRDWRKELSAREVAVFESRTRPLLLSLGYEPSTPDTVSGRARRFSHVARGIGRRVVRSAWRS